MSRKQKIILIGDSIRLGYENYVKSELAESAEVCSPEENCRFAQYALRYLHEWASKGKWGNDADAVHWNVGLWDVLRIMGDEPMTPVEFYADTVKRLDKRLRLLFPKAKMIFATSTSVVEERYGENFKRYNRDIEAYNAAAIRALSETDTVINDLYAHSVGIPDSARSDMTHFNTPEGAKYMGSRVVQVLREALGAAEND